MSERKYEKYVISELKNPETDPERLARYAQFAKRILWLDDKIVDGAFQMNCSWYLKPTAGIPTSHSHDYDEIIGFIGSDVDNPSDLCGEVELWLEDEQYIITKSTMVFVPKEMKHCPLKVNRVDKPIFHFTTVNGGQWIMKS